MSNYELFKEYLAPCGCLVGWLVTLHEVDQNFLNKKRKVKLFIFWLQKF
jgi:hypothetical protein